MVEVGTDVRMRGVVVGHVDRMQLVDRRVRFTLKMDRQYRVPASAVAAVTLKTLLGAKYVDLRFPAYRGPFLPDGGRIRAAQVGEVLYLDSPVSSSRIRRALQAGEVELARELLGRPYVLAGTVIHGESRGVALGFPTANLASENDLVPQDGVYVSEAVLDGAARPAVTNIGSRPTFEGAAYAIETHILDFPGDLYGRPMEVRLLARLRPELKFASPAALVEQVRRDVQRARDYFAVSRGTAC